MTRPEIVDKYIKISKELNQLKKEQELIRDDVLDLLNSGNEWEDIGLQISTSFDIDDDLVYDWLNKTFPAAIIKEVTRQLINWEKVDSLVQLGVIDINKIPEDCYEIKETQKIMTSRLRKQSND